MFFQRNLVSWFGTCLIDDVYVGVPVVFVRDPHLLIAFCPGTLRILVIGVGSQCWRVHETCVSVFNHVVVLRWRLLTP